MLTVFYVFCCVLCVVCARGGWFLGVRCWLISTTYCTMELSLSVEDSNCPQVHVRVPTYVGRVPWSHA